MARHLSTSFAKFLRLAQTTCSFSHTMNLHHSRAITAWASHSPLIKFRNISPPALCPIQNRTRKLACTSQAKFQPPTASPSSKTRNNDKEAVCVIIGGSRGIGLAMVQSITKRGWKGRIIATCRDKESSGALSALWQFMPDRFRVVEMDVCDEGRVEKAAEEISDWTNGRVDLLIHCAGVLHEDGKMPETSLTRVDASFMKRNFEVNTMGPVLVAKHFSGMMTTARKKGRVSSIWATLSARVGSISDNGIGGWLSYRVSKAGQNQAVRTASVELGRRGVICVSLHPGTVATDLSMPFRKNVAKGKLFDVDFAADALLDVVDSLEDVDNGSFLAYDRSEIPY